MARNLGIVLGGGGARGAFHAGALHKLCTNDVLDGGATFPRLDPTKMQALSVTGKDTAVGQWANIAASLDLPRHA